MNEMLNSGSVDSEKKLSSKKLDSSSSSCSTDSEVFVKNRRLAGVIKSVKSSIISSDDSSNSHSVDGAFLKKSRTSELHPKPPKKKKIIEMRGGDIYSKLSTISDKLECDLNTKSENTKANNFSVQECVNSTSDNNSHDELKVKKKLGKKFVSSKSSLKNECHDDEAGVNFLKNVKEETTDSVDIIKVEREAVPSDCDGDNSELNVDITPTKRKRGRPRKSIIHEESKCLNMVSTSKKRCKNVAKRGPGRPRKSEVIECSEPKFEYVRKTRQESNSTNGSTSRLSDVSSRKRRIIKPKRFDDSYDGFEYMDACDASVSGNVNVVDNTERIVAESLIITNDEEDDEDHEDEDITEAQECMTAPPKNDVADVKRRKMKGKGRFVKVALGREEENEFDAFGKNVALQLKQVPLQDALELQIKILSIISNKRLQLFK